MGFNVLNPQVHSSSPTFRSMNFNIEQARHHSVAQIAAAIGAESPDVVCLEEARDIEGFEFARLSKEFPGWHTAHGYNVALLSRFPLENIQIHPMAYEATRRKILEATATIKGRKVKVICVHYITTSMFRGGWNKISTQHFADEARVRRNTTQDLLELTRQSPYPVVIGGDFNTPPRNALYRLLRAELTDSFAEGGWGFGYSWNTDFPLLRIDYLWSKGLKVHRAWVSKTVASDHHPVITDFTW